MQSDIQQQVSQSQMKSKPQQSAANRLIRILNKTSIRRSSVEISKRGEQLADVCAVPIVDRRALNDEMLSISMHPFAEHDAPGDKHIIHFAFSTHK